MSPVFVSSHRNGIGSVKVRVVCADIVGNRSTSKTAKTELHTRGWRTIVRVAARALSGAAAPSAQWRPMLAALDGDNAVVALSSTDVTMVRVKHDPIHTLQVHLEASDEMRTLHSPVRRGNTYLRNSVTCSSGMMSVPAV